MAEKVFKELFCDIKKVKVCTTTADLNFDNYTEVGTYEIYESKDNGQSCVFLMTVDKSANGACTMQTRVHCGKVEERHHTSTGTWTDWKSTAGTGGGITDDEKQEIIDEVIAALPNLDEVAY